MIRNGKPPIKAVNIGPPIIAQNPATKEYVDVAVIPPNPGPPQEYSFQGYVDIDRMIQGYIPSGVNTTFRLSVLGGLLYKQGDTGNEFPNTPIRTTMNILTIRIFMHSVSQNTTRLLLTFFKDDISFIDFLFTIPSGSRNSNIISVGPGTIPYSDGDWGYATVEISGSIAANFCTIVMSSEQMLKLQ